jgi:hypothetical protein
VRSIHAVVERSLIFAAVIGPITDPNKSDPCGFRSSPDSKLHVGGRLWFLKIEFGYTPEYIVSKTYADTLHEEGVSVNTIRIRLGHESLDVTLAYLKGKDPESEDAQEHANSSSLALYA